MYDNRVTSMTEVQWQTAPERDIEGQRAFLAELKQKAADARREAERKAVYLLESRKDLDLQIAALESAWADAKHHDLLESEFLQKQADEAEELLRSEVVDFYRRTGEKQAGSGLSVRVKTSLKYAADIALGWAKINAPFLVVETIDKKKFEQIADGLEFVRTEETPSAVISWGDK